MGINPSGVMDPVAARLVNILLGNRDDEAVLEMHYPASHFHFGADAICAIGGADFAPSVDGNALDNWRAFSVPKDSILTFGAKRVGSRTYLAVAGGFDIEDWLGSASTNLAAKEGGFYGRMLRAGDEIGLGLASESNLPVSPGKISRSLIPSYSSHPVVRVIAGAEFDCINNKDAKLFSRMTFRSQQTQTAWVLGLLGSRSPFPLR
jgi:antagonist of KipI